MSQSPRGDHEVWIVAFELGLNLGFVIEPGGLCSFGGGRVLEHAFSAQILTHYYRPRSRRRTSGPRVSSLSPFACL